jgi:hypothetical protein
VAVANEAGNNVKGDFNGDGSRDLLFIHQSGLLYAWFMSDRQMVGGDYVAPERAPTGWDVAGFGDFNADGKSDLLVQNAQTGQLNLWAMDGIQRIDEVQLLPTGTPWRVAETGDFNGDGQTDILWRHPITGGVYVWLMDGPNMISGAYLNPNQVDLRWRIAGTADMNGDGRIDIVWQNNLTGELVVWHMTGLVATDMRYVSPGAVALVWRLSTVADMNLDGHADLVFQNTSSGHMYVWYMNKSQLQHGNYLAPAQVATVWRLGTGH